LLLLIDQLTQTHRRKRNENRHKEFKFEKSIITMRKFEGKLAVVRQVLNNLRINNKFPLYKQIIQKLLLHYAKSLTTIEKYVKFTRQFTSHKT
jgi:hypothetical protein